MAYTTIDDPGLFFNTVLYTGNGSDNHTITGVGFQPDMIWIKERSSTSSHYLTSVGLGIGTRLEPDGTSSESTEGISAVTSDGFTIGTSTNQVNQNTITHVAWNWLAGTSFSNDASATSVGSIDSTGSINTTAGFSIISWTGTGSAGTIAHGLGAAPEMYWVKNRDKSSQFAVFHKGIGNTHYLALNDSDAKADYAGYWSDTSPTSTVFSVGSDGDVSGASNEKVISYCFRSIQGYSKIGSYTGNGNANGPFVYTGFRPAWIFLKYAGGTGSWHIMDNKRDTDNPLGDLLLSDSSAATNTVSSERFDLLSNGFKCRRNDNGSNASGGSYIYMAFAESPFVNSNGVPTNAR